MQAFQTDSRLHELENRLNDAISLAAAAANTASYKRGFTGVVVEWVATGVVVPVQVAGWLVGLPLRVLTWVWEYGKEKMGGKDRGKKVNGNVSASGRVRLKVGNGKKIAP